MKTKTGRFYSSLFKPLLMAQIIILALALYSTKASGQITKNVKTEGAYNVVDIMPEFPGGNAALVKFVADSTHYPTDAKLKGIQGKVIARFMIKKDGSVSDVSIIKSVHPSIDNEALRVVKTIPRFTPGILNGEKVPVWYVIPITFALN